MTHRSSVSFTYESIRSTKSLVQKEHRVDLRGTTERHLGQVLVVAGTASSRLSLFKLHQKKYDKGNNEKIKGGVNE